MLVCIHDMERNKDLGLLEDEALSLEKMPRAMFLYTPAEKVRPRML